VIFVHDAPAIAPALAVTDEEKRAADRYATERLALRSRGARGLMRLVASRYLDCPPIEVPITRAPCIYCGEPHGKPMIDGSPVQINLSHAGDTVLIGVASSPVGVDVESPARGSDPLALSRRFFSAAEADWVAEANAVESRDRFLRLWVRKEAILKATSEGLPGGLESVPVLGPTPQTITREVDGHASRWTVADLEPALHPAAAVALAGEACEARVFGLPELDPSGRLGGDD
jgi:4'-phosphopantetheinyl transferase